MAEIKPRSQLFKRNMIQGESTSLLKRYCGESEQWGSMNLREKDNSILDVIN
jgi:hypothetical protein